MINLKPVAIKRSGKQDRERKVLLGLVEYYIKTGKPVGSNTLKDVGFADLSSATIRNYFAQLEEDGLLIQQHSSGGRIPTDRAYKIYAQEYENTLASGFSDEKLKTIRNSETREIASFLQKSAELLSELSHAAVFLTAPRFDHDYIIDLKLIPIDHSRCLCVIVTDFGMIQTEVLHVDTRLNSFSTKRIESYFHWRLTGLNRPENLSKEEEELAKKLYNELMVRYVVGYTNFTDEEIYRTGFSKLLSYPEFYDAPSLTNSLALFENTNSMRLLLRECSKGGRLKFWIGEDLSPYSSQKPNCAVLAIPYQINQQVVGAVGILGPIRMPYREIFGLMQDFVQCVNEALTRNIYKFKISFRQPQQGTLDIQKAESRLLGRSHFVLLEDKTRGE